MKIRPTATNKILAECAVMVRGLAIAFAFLFFGAHLADPHGDALWRPLSCFRDVEPSWVGYAMFVLLVATASAMARAVRRLGDRNQFIVYTVVACSLTLTALTPSNSELHDLGVFVTLFTLFGNFAWLLDQRDMPYWLTFHLSVPLLLLAAVFITPGETGHWQKALDLYFMVAVLVHHHWVQKGPVTSLSTLQSADVAGS